MFQKILVANRAEIAVRAFRAAYEKGVKTVAVFPHEDRFSEHRQKADEAYLIGNPGQPVKAYLDIEQIIAVAKKSGADAIYPGYGFLAENADFAQACEENGITFIGPSPQTLRLAGDKSHAIAAAKAAGIPTLQSTEPSTDVDALAAQADEIGFPIFVKAVAGGGGRGMRRVEAKAELREAIAAASREAEAAFGDGRVFLEQAVLRPRHIEVQILADAAGNVMHLYERDCSVQRRHQKVVEIAPAPNLDPKLREQLCADAVKFAQAVGYKNAGTVEFLVDTVGERAGQHVFIEMNPRIQVEHTVTEEITDVDLVGAQFAIASGATFADLGLRQEDIVTNGFAIQCRITTEDPRKNFQPDSGKIVAYRSPGGAGIRLDGATASAGSVVTGHFDSMLVKLTCHGRDYEVATRRARRALAEFRIRGLNTNIPFLQAVLNDADFRAGNVSTAFIDEKPELLNVVGTRDRATKLLNYVGDITVNQPYAKGQSPLLTQLPEAKLPTVDHNEKILDGSRQRLQQLGPKGFAEDLRKSEFVEITDTTFRDAHQSLLATRVRTYDLLRASEVMRATMPGLFSIEAWGGATYDVALRFLGEDPWQRLAKIREAVPNIALQMLLRGRNTVGYTPYPTEVTKTFVTQATEHGIDIFRIFDALNDVNQMRPAIEAVLETGESVAEVSMCYTGNLLDPAEDLYTLDYYLKLAEEIVATGAHILAIKDMAGVLRAPAAAKLVTALRERFDLPVHLHTHDTAGGQLATLLAAIDAGVDAVDVASATMAGTTSQVSMSALLAGLNPQTQPARVDLEAAGAIEPYWQSVRALYRPFESGLDSPTGRVYHHEIPGGQLSNLRQQAIALGLADRFEDIEETYAAADRILGRLIKVTPSSKVVGDLALQLVAQNTDIDDFEQNPQNYDLPDSVIGFLAGQLGDPPGGWPQPFRDKALQGREVKIDVGELTDEDLAALESSDSGVVTSKLNELLFPGPNRDFLAVQEKYGDISVLDTHTYLYGVEYQEEIPVDLKPGVRILIGLEAIGEPDDSGYRNVMLTLNGQLRPLSVRDKSVESVAEQAERADQGNANHVAAPFAGIVTTLVQPGDTVTAGQAVASIEAMKMEAAISAPHAGVVERVALSEPSQVSGGDLILVVLPKS